MAEVDRLALESLFDEEFLSYGPEVAWSSQGSSILADLLGSPGTQSEEVRALRYAHGREISTEWSEHPSDIDPELVQWADEFLQSRISPKPDDSGSTSSSDAAEEDVHLEDDVVNSASRSFRGMAIAVVAIALVIGGLLFAILRSPDETVDVAVEGTSQTASTEAPSVNQEVTTTSTAATTTTDAPIATPAAAPEFATMWEALVESGAVSYTHLTLPTIYSV